MDLFAPNSFVCLRGFKTVARIVLRPYFSRDFTDQADEYDHYQCFAKTVEAELT